MRTHRSHRRTSPRRRPETRQKYPESEFTEPFAQSLALASSRLVRYRVALGRADTQPPVVVDRGKCVGRQGHCLGIQWV
jgi:hypothetical protein